MKFKIVKYMTGYAIKRKKWFSWHLLKHGDYFPPSQDEYTGKTMMWETEQEAKIWLQSIVGISL